MYRFGAWSLCVFLDAFVCVSGCRHLYLCGGGGEGSCGGGGV